MAVNLDQPLKWKSDIARSVDMYNKWFLKFAPITYRQERSKATLHVESMLNRTRQLRSLTASELRLHPEILPALRMSTAPPLARDRLAGLTGLPKTLVLSVDRLGRLPPQMDSGVLDDALQKMADMILRLADSDIFPWLAEARKPTKREVYRAATIVADRLCGANADPIVRNAQEKRQLAKLKRWLEARGYTDQSGKVSLNTIRPGMFAFRLGMIGLREDLKQVNIPIDAVIVPLGARASSLPIMLEAKSAGDFTNTNKRRKEEALKLSQLRRKHGSEVQFILFLCGYFDTSYLGHEAGEGIDWVWEHRIDDRAEFGL